MEQYSGATPADHGADGGTGAGRNRRGRTVRRLLTLPVAAASTIAVTLGFVQPAAAAPQTIKRQPKPKAVTGAPAARASATAAAAGTELPAEVTVRDGDTVSAIAARYGLSTAEVLAENGLSWSSLIFPGQRLALPGGAAATSTTPSVPRPDIARHVVRSGETVSGIAAAYGLDTDVVLSANGLGPTSLIFPGQTVVLPARDGDPVPEGSADASRPTAPAPATADDVHVVVEGDTLIGIGERHGVALERLVELNPDAADGFIVPGQEIVLRVPAPVEATAVAMLDVPLDDEMRANAAVIVAVGRARGIPDRGIVIALAAAAQESGLRNLDHGDRDSLGLFQQRPSQGWGTADEVRDPERAAAAFYGGPDSPTVGTAPGLLDVDGWESMSLADAAQAVQRSAHPGHFAKWEASAERWLTELG
ncbi:LysM peptidoglycan-binding domain-containing protein [Agromyces aurantiacus]|uniref:LysM peptidoglycan-binding domain-containing protein n=1 Tax=Agromyces aurantiacus TaxID=165814 RepID=A0ABV9RAE7_9MICO|nr:LysM peptidoglycan-binding domain-containing protein [Agromyces aurantiacus]MBM7504587.1 LysM repeat protein [Agromyces aurantiacus]